MKCGKTDLCEVREIKGKYSVTWNKHITGLDVYSDKLLILIDMMLRDRKSFEVGLILSTGYVLWFKSTLLMTMTDQDLVDHVVRSGNVRDQREIEGVVFDNLIDVETFIDRLEKKYIIHVLKA